MTSNDNQPMDTSNIPAVQSIKECATCMDVKDVSYLLACLHVHCGNCIADMRKEYEEKGIKDALECTACKEISVATQIFKTVDEYPKTTEVISQAEAKKRLEGELATMNDAYPKIDERIIEMEKKQKRVNLYKRETIDTISHTNGLLFQLNSNFKRNMEAVIAAKVEEAKTKKIDYQTMESSLRQALEERYRDFYDPIPESAEEAEQAAMMKTKQWQISDKERRALLTEDEREKEDKERMEASIAKISSNRGCLGSMFTAVMKEYDTAYKSIGLTIDRLKSMKVEFKQHEAKIHILKLVNQEEQQVNLSSLAVSHLEGLLKEDYDLKCIRIFFIADGDVSPTNKDAINVDYIKHMGAMYTAHVPYEEKLTDNPHPFPPYIWNQNIVRSIQQPLEKSHYPGTMYLVTKSGNNGEIFAFGCEVSTSNKEIELLNELNVYQTSYSLDRMPANKEVDNPPLGIITNHFKTHLKYPKDMAKIKTRDIVCTYPDENNGVWVLTNNSCVRFSKDDDTKVVELPKVSGLVCRALCVEGNIVYILYADGSQNNYLFKHNVSNGERSIVELSDTRSTNSLARDKKASILYVPDYDELFVYFKTTGVMNAFDASTGKWVREYRNRQQDKDFYIKGTHLEHNTDLFYVKKINKMLLFSKGKYFWYYYAGGQTQTEPAYHDVLEGYSSLVYCKHHNPHELTYVMNRVQHINRF